MDVVHYINKSFSRPFEQIKRQLWEFNQNMNSRKRIKGYLRFHNIPKLTPQEDKAVRLYFKSKGYTLNHTDWHAYYKARSGQFHLEYIPRGFFKTKISPKLNQTIQWPALLDKNLAYRIFRGFDQPERVVQNINGLYYINEKQVSHSEAVLQINQINGLLIIKPSLDSGGGKMVTAFKILEEGTSYKNLSIEDLLRRYKKDFIVQKFVDQSKAMRILNPSSLNTFRVVSYLNNEGVHILSVNAKIGGENNYTDNYTTGGFICGIDQNGKFKSKGYSKNGGVLEKTATGIKLQGYLVPNYKSMIKMVKSMHLRVPYFRLISWDIGVNSEDSPILIEFNTYNQGFEQQICNGPLFGEFTDEVFAEARK